MTAKQAATKQPSKPIAGPKQAKRAAKKAAPAKDRPRDEAPVREPRKVMPFDL